MEQQKLNELLAKVIGQVREAGIPAAEKICPEVRVNHRARSRFGCCIRRESGCVIELSGHTTRAEEKEICQVLAHEVLHTCPGCADHGARWQSYARKMNSAYGYRISRTDSFERLGIEDGRMMKYAVICRKCGSRNYRMKRSALVEHPERYRCRCGGTLQVETLEGQG